MVNVILLVPIDFKHICSHQRICIIKIFKLPVEQIFVRTTSLVCPVYLEYWYTNSFILTSQT